jgi:hypothetical protein
MKIPAHFPKWNKTIDGLEDAALWVLDYERSRLPANTVFPRMGQVWEPVRDCQVSFRACIRLRRPKTNSSGLLKGFGLMFEPAEKDLSMRGGRTLLSQGEKVRILDIDPDKPVFVNFLPLRYQELHATLVPEHIRGLPGYNGYELFVKTAKTTFDFGREICHTYFNEAFQLVEDVA